MTAEDRFDSDRMAIRLALDHARLEDFARAATILLSVIPLAYGVLTWVFGERLWESNQIYATALTVPGAPQSWGFVFIVMGVGTIVAAHQESNRCIVGFALSTALVLATFMATFITELVRGGTVSAYVPVVVYAVLSLLFLARAHMAWASVRGRRG